MTYSEDFRNLLEYAPDDYIGFGNPNGKILSTVRKIGCL